MGVARSNWSLARRGVPSLERAPYLPWRGCPTLERGPQPGESPPTLERAPQPEVYLQTSSLGLGLRAWLYMSLIVGLICPVSSCEVDTVAQVTSGGSGLGTGWPGTEVQCWRRSCGGCRLGNSQVSCL